MTTLRKKHFGSEFIVSYRLTITLCFVGFGFLSASFIAYYLFLGITRTAEESAKREIGIVSANVSQHMSQLLELEITRAWNLARDSDVLLATRSLLFIDDALNRIQDHQNASTIARGVYLINQAGDILTNFPRGPETSKNISAVIPNSTRISLLKEKEDKEFILPQELRIVANQMGHSRDLTITVPVRSFAGLSGFLMISISVERLKYVLRQITPENMKLNIGFEADDYQLQQLGDEETNEKDETIASRAEVNTHSPAAYSDRFFVSLSEPRESRLAEVHNNLRKTLLLLMLLCLATAVSAYFVSLLFVNPLRSLTRFIESFKSENRPYRPHELFEPDYRFSEFRMITRQLIDQKKTINQQIETLASSVSELEHSNAKLRDLSNEVRKIASCNSFGNLIEVLNQATKILLGKDNFLLIKNPAPPEISWASIPQAQPHQTIKNLLSGHDAAEIMAKLPEFNWRSYTSKDEEIIVLSGFQKHGLVDSEKTQQDPNDTREELDPSQETLIQAIKVTVDKLKLIEKIREEERLRASLQNAKIEVELMTLKNQINPHFLFNSLNSIAHLVEEDPERSIASIARLSDLYRKILEVSGALTTDLEKELQIVELYLELEKTRFTDRLKYSIDNKIKFDDSIEDPVNCASAQSLATVYVPSLMLQTLVENAVKHGISKSLAGGEIAVTIERFEGRYRATVSNTGAVFEQNLKGGAELQSSTRNTRVGLANTRKRLELLYGNQGQLEIQSDMNNRTQVTIIFTGAKV